ncbi:MAG: GC-type dockerin domain-anchored protein [Planctomycetota bacterium]
MGEFGRVLAGVLCIAVLAGVSPAQETVSVSVSTTTELSDSEALLIVRPSDGLVYRTLPRLDVSGFIPVGLGVERVVIDRVVCEIDIASIRLAAAPSEPMRIVASVAVCAAEGEDIGCGPLFVIESEQIPADAFGGSVFGGPFTVYGEQIGPIEVGAPAAAVNPSFVDVPFHALRLAGGTLQGDPRPGRLEAYDVTVELTYDLTIEFGEDCNGDGVADIEQSFGLVDCNQDGLIDSCQIAEDPLLDCDLNGVIDVCETTVGNDCDSNGLFDDCEMEADPSLDCNENGVLDRCEASLKLDCDQNGVLDSCELGADPSLDCNANGVLDRCEATAGRDCDRDGVLDDCEMEADPSLDCNLNGVLDVCELSVITDCDGNGVLDSCEIVADPGLDCDANGELDQCQFGVFGSGDCNGNGILDGCEIVLGLVDDCDGNEWIDACEIAEDPWKDCNLDGWLDSCELAVTSGGDCDTNGRLDSCEIAVYPSLDCDGNGVHDACDIAFRVLVWDEDEDGLSDQCEIAQFPGTDCNGNSRLDKFDPVDPVQTLRVPDHASSIVEAISMLPCEGGIIELAQGVYDEGVIATAGSVYGVTIRAEPDTDPADIIVLGCIEASMPLTLSGFTLRPDAHEHEAAVLVDSGTPDGVDVAVVDMVIEDAATAFEFRGGDGQSLLFTADGLTALGPSSFMVLDSFQSVFIGIEFSKVSSVDPLISGFLRGQILQGGYTLPTLDLRVASSAVAAPRLHAIEPLTEGVVTVGPFPGDPIDDFLSEDIALWVNLSLVRSTLTGVLNLEPDVPEILPGSMRSSGTIWTESSIIGGVIAAPNWYGSYYNHVSVTMIDDPTVQEISADPEPVFPGFIYRYDVRLADAIGPDGVENSGDEDLRLSPTSSMFDAIGSVFVEPVPDVDGRLPFDLPGRITVFYGPGRESLITDFSMDLGAYEFHPPAPCGPADLTSTGGALLVDPSSGLPDGLVNLDDLGFFIDGWLIQDPIADIATPGVTNNSDPSTKAPDGDVDLTDLGAYLSFWLGGCV